MTPALATMSLKELKRVADYSQKDWELLLRQLRASNLTASFGERLRQTGLDEHIPANIRWHFAAIANVASRHRDAVLWEVSELQNTLGVRGIPVVLLKGAAYVAGGHQAGHGRLFFDIDILVPQHALGDVEEILGRHGWAATHLNDYDQRFYRDWSHELPPMQHRVRGTTLDIHHTIIPPTAKLKPDAGKLLADAVPIKGQEEIYTLAPVDMLLHSATHLFHDGELDHGLRDLVDLDNLMREFSERPGFWDTLLQRAEEQQLTRPLYYALHYCSILLGSDIPEAILERSRSHAPAGLSRQWMDTLFLRALQPDHSTCNDGLTGFARWGLFVRSHYLRMPLRLLIPHLLYKATIAPYRERQEDKKAQQVQRIFGHLRR